MLSFLLLFIFVVLIIAVFVVFVFLVVIVVVFVVLVLVVVLVVTVDIVVSVVIVTIIGPRNLALRFSKNWVSYSCCCSYLRLLLSLLLMVFLSLLSGQ